MTSAAAHAGLNLLVYPSTLTNASRVFKLARSLQEELGFESTHAVGIRAGDLPAEEHIAPRVVVRRISGSERSGNLGRVLKVLLWQPRVYREYRDRPLAAVAAQNVWVLPLCHRLARRTGAVFVYNPHELETETVAMSGFKRVLARWIERRYAPRADVCSTVNESIARWYRDTYRMPLPIPVTNIPMDAPASPPTDLRALLDIPEEDLLFVHTGHLTAGRNIPAILSAFAGLEGRHVVFVGDGPLEGLIADAARRWAGIHRVPPVPADGVVAAVRSADVGLCLIEAASLSLQLSTPNKLFEALASATPVLATDLPEIRRVLGAHAERWTVHDVHELRRRVSEVTPEMIDAFHRSWGGIGTWEDQTQPLVAAYRDALDAL